MFVNKPDRFSQDVIVPGRVTDPNGFVTLHRSLDGLHGPIQVYFSVTGLRQIAEKHPQVGLVPADDVRRLHLENDALRAELDQANARIAELEANAERIAGFARDGFKVQKVVGRPKGS